MSDSTPPTPAEGTHAEAAAEANRRILRGDLTIEEAVDRGILTLADVQRWQARYLVPARERPEADGKPWERPIADVWNVATRGRLRYLTVPLFFVFIVVPAFASLYDSGSRLLASAAAALARERSEMTPSELDVCNEWVARVSRHPTKEDARKEQEALLQTMKRDDDWTWVDDIHIARDTEHAGQYLLLVDMFSGPSDRGSVDGEIQRLRAVSPNGMGNRLEAARAFYYRLSAFEALYGKLSPTAVQCHSAEMSS